MNGQLWQECAKRGCDTEPVCAECEYCERHCGCSRKQSDRQQVAEFNAAYPGFLDALEVHHEQGAQEND